CRRSIRRRRGHRHSRCPGAPPGPAGQQPRGRRMRKTRLVRAADTLRGAWLLVRVHLLFWFGGREAVARATAEAMRTVPATQAELDARGVDAWHTARAVWRARRLLPLRSQCLHTALALRALFQKKGCPAAVRVGVRAVG